MKSKKTVLLIDDDNSREKLCELLIKEYFVLKAEERENALAIIKNKYKEISAILLEPDTSGIEGYSFIKYLKENSIFANIPIIIVTRQSKEKYEALALEYGAMDFLVKPYKSEVILYRLANIIRFRETTSLIRANKKDKLTKLYNKEIFYTKVNEVLDQKNENAFDMICIDIEGFKLINDIYGEKEGDKLLCYIADIIKKAIQPIQGICCRMTADVFMVFIPRQKEYKKTMVAHANKYLNHYPLNMKIVLKFGIYQIDNVKLSARAICDRAKLAIKSIKGKYETYLAYYDDTIRNNLIEEQQITNDMKKALAEGQFHVYYQPKFDLETEMIVGAEALVRWIHPIKGFLSPDKFIELFERNGFITNLDLFVWETVCKKIRSWIDDGITPVPVSVNISRVDIYAQGIAERIKKISEYYDVDPMFLRIEITETAYTQNPSQLIEVVKCLKNLGFAIEMDDFGTGYSSLNMINEVPVDTLKMDMHFLDKKQPSKNSSNILNFIVNLAKWLGLTIVAEGIETKEQVELLKSISCDFGQGYYFSRPLPQEKFEEILLNYVNTPDRNQDEPYFSLIQEWDIWNTNSEFNKMFNQYIGALGVFEYIDGKLHLIRVNSEFYRLRDIITHHKGANILELIDNRDEKNFRMELEKAIAVNGQFIVEARWKNYFNSEDTSWYRSRGKVITKNKGRVVLLGAVEDISYQKKVCNQLVLEVLFWKHLYKTIPCWYALISDDKDKMFLDASDSFIYALGFLSRKDFLNRNRYLGEFITESWKKKVMSCFNKDSDNREMDYELLNKKGNHFWVHMIIDISQRNNEKVYQTIFMDITKFKERELEMPQIF